MTDNWDGKERRKDSQSWIERDRLLTDIHRIVLDMKESVKEHFAEDNVNFEKLDKRISSLESWMWKAVGAVAVVILIVNVVFKH